MSLSTLKKPARDHSAKAPQDPMISEILQIADEVTVLIHRSCHGALRIGLRLLALHKRTGDTDAPGGFRAALEAVEHIQISRPTAYRWLNAASGVLAKHQGITDPSDLRIPTDPETPEWKTAEKAMESAAKGMSIRRLLVGSSAIGDESRLETLISDSEAGDPHATAMLEKVASGELTLVQAIRAAAGAKATKEKARHDPVYLDIDGTTGRLKGLFPRCIITLANTFARWEDLDEAARSEAKKAWKSLAINIPKELR